MNNSKRIYRAAIYVRLSKEDGDLDDVRKAESNSISNQKSLILNYLKDKEDIEIVSIREDDGYSGATFDRPAFKLMMQDVKDGIIDCIVVKDLSRFAREYIDAGRYIERMFPAMGIRFIAINDAYDSADTQAQGNEIIIPFKNLINDAYCRDISIKIRSHLETKRQNGEFVGNYCVYGYKKSEIDHNVIVPDEYAGPVVQDIFHWIKNGMSLDAISDKLNALGILSPMAYKLSKGENYKTAFQKKDELLWTPVAVRRIATNIIYTGTLVQGKITTPNHKVKTRILKPQEKWAVCHNNHEALVSLRTFQIVRIIGIHHECCQWTRNQKLKWRITAWISVRQHHLVTDSTDKQISSKGNVLCRFALFLHHFVEHGDFQIVNVLSVILVLFL